MKKVIMYLSSLIPIFLLMITKEYLIIIVKIFRKELAFKAIINPILIIGFMICLIIIVLFVYLIKNVKGLACYKVRIFNINNRSSDYYLQYFSTFLISLFEFSLLNIENFIVFTLLVFVLGIIYIKNELFFINPTINIFQSMIYEVDTEEYGKRLIICKQKLKEGDIVEIYISEFNFTFIKINEDKTKIK